MFVKNEDVYKVLKQENDDVLLLKVGGHNLPYWTTASDIAEWETVEIPARETEPKDEAVINRRFSMISAVLDVIEDKELRALRINQASIVYGVSRNTICNYLNAYLVYGKNGLGKPKKPQKEITPDEANMRWALNKYYYNSHKNSLSYVYRKMLLHKYTVNGKLVESYPTERQFRYYFEKHNRKSNELISRNGLSNYKRNDRPCTGDYAGYFPNVGVGMLDATVCDIYLVNEAGELAGRPQLNACIDAYSGLCMGYSLTWEQGMYALRNLILNVAEPKVQHCKQYGINIAQEDWDCDCLPGTFITDMGKEFASSNFENLTELGITIINLDPYRPDNKSKCEKFFDVIQGYYKPILQGRGVIQTDYAERGSVDYRRQACLTMEDFQKVILNCIVYYNRDRLQRNFGMTEEMLDAKVHPDSSSIWNYGKQLPSANLINVDRETLIHTLLPRTEGVFRRNGLHVNGMRYHNENYAEEYLNGKTVKVAYDPDNCNKVWVVDDAYVCFNLIEGRFANKSLEAVGNMKKQQKEMVQSAEQEETQASTAKGGGCDMAINKTVNKSTKTHGAMRNCMEYVLRDSKINSSLVYVSGPFDAEEITYDTVYRSFLDEKKLWNKDSGRMYAHNIISWHKDEEIAPEEAYEFGKEFVEQWFEGFQTLMAVHVDRDHIHLHMVTNTVSYIDGHKLHTTKDELEEMKQLTNRMCEARGWHTPEKGKDYHGNELEIGHIRAWSKDKYHMLLHNAKESYVAACALALLEAKADACSQDDFVRNMKQKGWHVVWKPTRKNITFVNEEGKKVRDRNILKTFNINVTKGELLDEFIRNNERRNGVLRDDEEERIRRAAEDAELAGYYQQVQDALEGTGAGDSAEGLEDITTGEVVPGERRSVREALATKGRTKGSLGAEDRKREEQLPVSEPQVKRNRRRAR